MKKILLILILSVFALSSCESKKIQKENKPYILRVKVYENDCFKCMNGQLLVRKLAEIADVELVFNGLEDDIIQRFLKINVLDRFKEQYDVKIISDSKEYAELNTVSSNSEGYIYDLNGNLLFTFPFRMDVDSYNQLQGFINKCIEKDKNDKMIRLNTEYESRYMRFSIMDDYFVLFGPTINYCQVFDYDGKEVAKIDGTNINPLDIFDATCDENQRESYDASLEYLKENGMFQAIMMDVNLINEEIWVTYSIPSLETYNGSFALRSYRVIFNYPLGEANTSNAIVYNGKQDSIPSMTLQQFSRDNTFLAVRKGSSLDSTKLILSVLLCNYEDGSIVYSDERRITYPIINYQNNIGYAPKIKDSLLWLNSTDWLYDLMADSLIMLPFSSNLKTYKEGNSMNFFTDYDCYLCDWSNNGEDLGIVYHNNIEDCYFHAVLSKRTGKWVTRKIEFNDGIQCSHFSLATPNLVYCLTNNSDVIAKVF